MGWDTRTVILAVFCSLFRYDGLMDGWMDGWGGRDLLHFAASLHSLQICISLQTCVFIADLGGGLSERSIA